MVQPACSQQTAKLPVILLPPDGPHANRAKNILLQYGWNVIDLANFEEPSERPRVLFLVDLTAERRAPRLSEALGLHDPLGSGFIVLISHWDSHCINAVCQHGPCVFWHPDEPDEALVERVQALEDQLRALWREARVWAMQPVYRVAQFFGDVTDLDALLQRVLETAVEETDGDRGSVMLVDETGKQLYIAAAAGLPEHIVRLERQRIGEGIAGWVAAHRRPLVLTEGEIPPLPRRGCGAVTRSRQPVYP